MLHYIFSRKHLSNAKSHKEKGGGGESVRQRKTRTTREGDGDLHGEREKATMPSRPSTGKKGRRKSGGPRWDGSAATCRSLCCWEGVGGGTRGRAEITAARDLLTLKLDRDKYERESRGKGASSPGGRGTTAFLDFCPVGRTRRDATRPFQKGILLSKRP